MRVLDGVVGIDIPTHGQTDVLQASVLPAGEQAGQRRVRDIAVAAQTKFGQAATMPMNGVDQVVVDMGEAIEAQSLKLRAGTL